ncbi:MAG: AIM24 family protein [Actinomycetota bacterium]
MIHIAANPTQLSNAASHILKATITPNAPLRVRRNRIMSAVGDLEYRLETHDLDVESTNPNPDGRSTRRVKDSQIIKSVARRVKPELKLSAITAGNLVLHHTTGTGDLYLGHQGGDVTVFELSDDHLVVFKQNEILAHSHTITTSLDPVVGTDLGLVLESRHAWVLAGTGELATATSGEVIVLDITDDDQPIVIEAEALLARTKNVTLTKPDNYNSRIVGRTIAQSAKYLPYDIDLGRTKIWLNATGTGQVVIRSSD